MLNIYADHYFHIGQVHLSGGKPCQDYALSKVSDETACIVVSDGCSMAGNTDMGARVLAYATMSAISDKKVKIVPSELNIYQQLQIGIASSVLGMERNDLLATCLCASITQSGGFVHVRGDGVIAWRTRHGSIYMMRFDWPGNMPFYPAYSQDNFVSFVDAHGGDLDAPTLMTQLWSWMPDVGFEQVDNNVITLEQGITGVTQIFSGEQVCNELAFVAAFTDGVTQVDGMDWKDAVVQLFAFKNVAGEFAKRRMIRMIKDSKLVGHGPLDDIAYAVVRVADESPESEVLNG
jgi:hypothetical protein